MADQGRYAYLPQDFGQSLPDDPVAVAQTVATLTLTLDRGAMPVAIALTDDALAAPTRLAGHDFAAGDGVRMVWSLVDSAKGVRLTGCTVTAAADGVERVVVLSALPLKPGQSYQVSLPIGQDDVFIGGFARGTRILTQAGKRPVEDIAPGDRVWTEAAGFVPVLWHGVQTVPARGQAAPVRLRRGLMGLSDDLLLAGTQGVGVETPEGAVLIPAAAFETAGLAERDFGATVTWHQLLLPAHAVIFAHGLPCESLWAAQIPEGARPADWPAGFVPPDAPARPRLSEEAGARHLR